jgi:hypothetical protein
MVADRTRARHRLGMFLLRHGRAWRGGNAWTLTRERWLLAQRFEQPALAATYGHDRAVLAARDAQLEAIQAERAGWYDRAPFADAVHRLAAYRGITRLGALTLASEVCDWRRFGRAAAFAGFCGLVPSEYSSGTTTRRGHTTKTGNAHLRAQLAWVGLVLPVPARGRGRPAPAAAGPGSPGGRPGLGGAAAGCAGAFGRWPPARTPKRGRHRDRPGAHWVPVGRDGGLTCPPAIGHRLDRRHGDRQPHAAPGTAAGRTDPRQYCATAAPARASSGHLPASSRPAVSTRVRQCGGSPIHHAPARRANHGARPPPTGTAPPPRRCTFHPGPRRRALSSPAPNRAIDQAKQFP